MPPQTNAAILTVTGAGAADDWDRPAVAGGEKWSGFARAYYREATEREATDVAVNVAVRRELIVDTATLDELGVDTDDTIEFRVDGRAASTTGKARAIRRSELADVARDVQTAKITLDDA